MGQSIQRMPPTAGTVPDGVLINDDGDEEVVVDEGELVEIEVGERRSRRC